MIEKALEEKDKIMANKLEEKNHLIRVDYYNLLREVSEAPMSKLTRAKVNHLVNSLIAESASKSVRISQLVEAVTLANNVLYL